MATVPSPQHPAAAPLTAAPTAVEAPGSLARVLADREQQMDLIRKRIEARRAQLREQERAPPPPPQNKTK